MIVKQSVRLSLATGMVMMALAACNAPATSVPLAATTAPTTVAPTAAVVATTAPTEAPTAAAVATTAPTEAPTATVAATVAPTAPVAVQPAVNTKLNLNTAAGDEYLATIPNFSSRMVREFLEYRPYASIQQFRREIGKYVDDAQVAQYEQYVYVPVDVNQSDAATLLQIPGLDQAAADALIAGRPYASNGAFLAALAQAAPTVDAATAASYLAD
ncbi:MAG: hypothetical protein WAZ19_16815 [Anaerolineae bacterium]